MRMHWMVISFGVMLLGADLSSALLAFLGADLSSALLAFLGADLSCASPGSECWIKACWRDEQMG